MGKAFDSGLRGIGWQHRVHAHIWPRLFQCLSVFQGLRTGRVDDDQLVTAQFVEQQF